ncbi:MAG TPA: hypothetical protein VIH57_05540, partial [Bacteroidales bacterium]
MKNDHSNPGTLKQSRLIPIALFRFFVLTLLLYIPSWGCAFSQQPLFRNSNAPIDDRINDLMHTLTLKEKISLLGFRSPGVERLQIPAYNWWNEALHGVARGGEATVFPQAIAIAATFNDRLIREVSTAISTEARAKYNLTTAMDRHMQYMGLT